MMFRDVVPDDTGMLFVFADNVEHPFWMKNTKVSLDMLFLDSSGTVVGIITKAKPGSEQSLTVGLPSRYVLEVPGGYCGKHNIHLGARVKLPY